VRENEYWTGHDIKALVDALPTSDEKQTLQQCLSSLDSKYEELKEAFFKTGAKIQLGEK
jgi:hypothetical protein